MTQIRGGPLVVRGSLSDWERELRARMAIAEEEEEIFHRRAEITALHEEVARLQADVMTLQTRLGVAHRVLADIRGSRGYRLIRLFGRWSSIEQGMRRAFR